MPICDGYFDKEIKTIIPKCSYNKKGVCSLCGCNLEAKTRVKSEFCDIGKW